mgnify:CR=1 FL=1
MLSGSRLILSTATIRPNPQALLFSNQEKELGIPSPEETAGEEWKRTVRGKKVILRAKEKIRRLARKRGVSMSTDVSEEFEKYKV